MHYIPYAIKHKHYARENRKNQTLAEKIARQTIFRRKQTGYKVTRQKPLGPFIADFYCSKLLLVIEIDGGYHNTSEQILYDQARTTYLNGLGINVLRVTNEQIINNGIITTKYIIKSMNSREEELIKQSTHTIQSN